MDSFQADTMIDDCTIYKTLNRITKKWCLMIVLSIHKGDKNRRQYSEIKRDLNLITPKVLSTRLKELEENGIIKKEMDNSKVPINTFYSLNKSGEDLLSVINTIKKWGVRWNYQNKQCDSQFCKNCTL